MFLSYWHIAVLLDFANADSHHLHALTRHVAIPLFVLSIIAGAILGTRAACEVLRVRRDGVPPLEGRVSLYGLVLSLMAVTALMPILLYLDED